MPRQFCSKLIGLHWIEHVMQVNKCSKSRPLYQTAWRCQYLLARLRVCNVTDFTNAKFALFKLVLIRGGPTKRTFTSYQPFQFSSSMTLKNISVIKNPVPFLRYLLQDIHTMHTNQKFSEEDQNYITIFYYQCLDFIFRFFIYM